MAVPGSAPALPIVSLHHGRRPPGPAGGLSLPDLQQVIMFALSRLRCTVLLATLLPPAVSADVLPEPEPIASLTAVAAVQRAVSWHPTIGRQAALVQQQLQARSAARAGYYPQVNGGLRSGYERRYDDAGVYPELILSVSQMLYDFGKVSSAVRSAEAASLAQQARLLLTVDDIALQTAEAALEARRQWRLEQLAREQYQGLAAVAGLVERRHQQGASSLSDAIQSQQRVEVARAQVLDHAAQRARWEARLGTLVGAQGPRRIEDRLPADLGQSCSPDDLERQAVPALLMARAERAHAEAELDLARAQRRPTLTLDPSVSHYVDDLPRMGGVDSDRTDYSLFLNMNMPLYQGGSLRAQEKAAQHALAASDAGLRQALTEARQTLREADEQRRTLAPQEALLQAREQLSLQTRDLYRQQYLELGTRPLLDLLNAEQDIHQARMALENLQGELQKFALSCAFASGTLRDAFGLNGQSLQGVEITP